MPEALKEKIDHCMLRDRHRLRRHLRQIKTSEEVAQAVKQQIETSAAVAEARREALPQPSFPANLPVVDRLAEIRELIENNQVVVLCGETGSGKSTQLPKICLDIGRGVFGRIGHTQPRRIAARSLASRIASELGQEVGQSVGYKVRFADKVNELTHIKLLTDGMLLAEIQQDKFLNEYDTLIIDEAHERSLNIDFLLGYIRQLLPKRPDLKVIVTSATIDPERFSRHFYDAPIIEVSGRTYPVEVRYRPPDEEALGESDDVLQTSIANAIDELNTEDRGDILIFLSGEREIRETAETLRKQKLQLTEVLPLYARLSPAEQSKIFKSSGVRRIVLATNVAETSLTVPGIRYVIDAGYARISRYSARSKIQRLPVERISQASANQRKGRCGRVSEGVCIRLYDEEEFLVRPEFTEPEIQRTNLAAVILQMKALGFGDIDAFPFIDPPDTRMIKDGYRVLEELGAVDGLRKISKIGRKLSRLPVDPRIGRMLLEGAHTGCLTETLVIAAALSVQDPRDRPMDKQAEADEAHALFKDERSDFIGYLKLWEFVREKRKELTRRKFTRVCREYFLSSTRVREWMDIHQQLSAQMEDLGYKRNEKKSSYDPIHMAMLSGLLSHIGFRPSGDEREYLGARNTRFKVFPGSGVFSKQPKWLMAAELVETTQLYGRGIGQIDPAWVESLAGHLVKRSYSEPHWQARKGMVGAYEKVSLFGLPVVARRKVNYGPINPEEAREIFIRFGLVEGEVYTRAPFWGHNKELIADVHAMEAKSRRRDILVDEEAIYGFYNSRLPAHVVSTQSLEKWLKKIKDKQPKLLYMSMQDLLRKDTEHVSQAQFPDHLMVNGMQLPLSYHFEPGHDADGVTLTVPVAMLNQVSQGIVDWLVPGLIHDKIVTMMKTLPKAIRRQFVPVPDYATRCLQEMQPSETPLIQQLGTALKKLSGHHVSEDAWSLGDLSPFLKMRIQVMSADAKSTLAASRDLATLQQQYAAEGAQAPLLGESSSEYEQSGMLDWLCGDLPEVVETKVNGIKLKGYPALIDEGDTVALKLMDSESNARIAHHQGLRRLFMLKLNKSVRYLRKNLPNLQQMRLQYAKVAPNPKGNQQGKKADLEQELIILAFDQTFIAEQDEIKTQQMFEQRLADKQSQVTTQANQAAESLAKILKQYHATRKALSGMTQINWLTSIQDMQAQLDVLVYQGFLHEIDGERLQHYPRYLKAIELRIDKLRHNPGRDQSLMRDLASVLQPWQQRYAQMQKQGRFDERLEEVRWLIEELRVSLFAQELKTALPVSVKRIQKRWQELGL